MSDLKAASLKEVKERFRSPYERVEEMVRTVKPFVKVRRLVRLPKPGNWRRQP